MAFTSNNGSVVYGTRLIPDEVIPIVRKAVGGANSAETMGAVLDDILPVMLLHYAQMLAAKAKVVHDQASKDAAAAAMEELVSAWNL